MNKAFGFLVTCVLVPGLYAGAAYYWDTQTGGTPSTGLRWAGFMAFPIACCCVVQWWDVWMKPLPKLGAFWAPMPPSRFLGETVLVHGGIVAISLVLQLLNDQKQEFGQSTYNFARAKARLDEFNRKVKAASERLEPFRDKARDNFPYNDLQQDRWLNQFPEAIAFQNARKERDEQRDEIEREEKEAEEAKPATNMPFYPLFIGVAIAVLTAPMQNRQYSGSPITQG